MQKKIIIIPTDIKSDKFINCIDKSYDLLALSPGAMLSIDNLNIQYKTLEDFYKIEIFRKDIQYFYNEVEKIFIELDEICKQFTDFPYCYTGNIYHFLFILTDIFLLKNLSEVLEKVYDKIYIYNNSKISPLLWNNLTYSQLQYIPQITEGLGNKIQLLKELLDGELVSDGSQEDFKIPHKIRIKSFLIKLPQAFKECIKGKLCNIFKEMQLNRLEDQKINLFVIKDGYEIAHLKRYLPDANFINPIDLLEDKIVSIPYDNIKLNEDEIVTRLEPFFERNFPKLKTSIESLFLSYHREIVGRIVQWKESIEELIDHKRPKMFLYSTGFIKVIDALFGYIANNMNIPVICFQHGGINFAKHPFLKYSERYVNIKKTLILHAKAEIEQANHEGSKCVAFGSMRLYQLLRHNSKSINKKAIYCCGPLPYWAYKEFLFNADDKKCYQINRDILEIADENSLPIDIKLHPTEQDYSLNYFSQLIKAAKQKKTHIIYNIPAELIMKSYGLIIIDYLVTSVIYLAIALKVPVILYLKDLSVVDTDFWDALQKRCYIVQDREMLRSVIARYIKGDLPSKWSEEIIDRYVYPVENGDPGWIIADYIKSVSMKSMAKI